MLMKGLILVAILFVIYIAFFKKSNNRNNESKRKNKKPELKGDIMMECQECGTFVSEDDAIIKDGKFYCSKECAGLK